MLVTLTPGVDRYRVLELLRTASIEIVNSRGDQVRYMKWVLNTAGMLRGHIARTDVEQLLLTPGFYRLINGTQLGPQLLDAEICDREALLIAAANTLQAQIEMWTAAIGKELAMVDTSVFLSHPAWKHDDDPTVVIASIPWAGALGIGFEDIQLVLPEVVIRELDRLKEVGSQKVRYRASVTLAVLDRLLPDPDGTVTIRFKDHDIFGMAERGEMPRGHVELRVFYDDLAHRPIRDPDREIIDRALAVQILAGKPVTLVTMDTGMNLNARKAGLRVRKPAREIEPPPAEGPSRRAQRRARAEEGGAQN